MILLPMAINYGSENVVLSISLLSVREHRNRQVNSNEQIHIKKKKKKVHWSLIILIIEQEISL